MVDMSFRRKSADRFEGGPLASPVDLAWCGGFFDGEGCISAVLQRHEGRRSSYRLRVQLSQTEYTSIDRFRRALGVSAAIYPVAPANGRRRTNYTLLYDGRKAKEVIQRLRPYLHRKLDEAVVAERLWDEGRLGCRSGGHGHDEGVWDLRAHYFTLLRSMKR